MMVQLAISLLGTFQVTLDGRPVTEFATDKARALLAYLAVERRQTHRREYLAALLWPEQSEERARQNLRQGLSYLRQALCEGGLAPPFIWVERNEVGLNPEADVWLDVAEFTALVEANAVHRHRGQAACLPCLRRAEARLALYRGEFLAGFMLADSVLFEEWSILKREWLHIQAIEALDLLAGFYERRGDIDKAQRYAVRLVQLEPWREEAHRQLMRLLYLTGQRSAALAQYETCRRILREEFDVEPAAATTHLFSQIKAEAPGAGAGATPPCRLPAPGTPFVGREAERAELTALLADPDCRLATLVGPGGIGKTRLALQVAGEHAGLYPDGVFWIACDTVSATAWLVPTVAQVLGLSLHGRAAPQVQLVNYLEEKTLLLVLDSVEHLPDMASLVEAILHSSPGVALLITSRERLALREESVFALEGLVFPDRVETPGSMQAEAVTFFVAYGRRVDRKLAIDAASAAAIVEICRLVEGMPLALELAAAWLPQLTCTEVAHRLRAGLDVLESSLHNRPDRRRSVRATFEYSWALLPEAERECFACLSVFRGGFETEAASRIAGVDPDLLPALVAKSLVRRLPGGRYQMHGLLQSFAAEKLISLRGSEDGVAGRHAAYYMTLLQAQEPDLKGAGQTAALARLTTEMPNVRRAWEWAVVKVESGDVPALEWLRRGLESLSLVFTLRSWYHEGAATFARAAEAVGDRDGVLLGALLAHQARCLEFTAPTEEAIALYQRSLAGLQALGAELDAALPLYGLGYMAHLEGDYHTARIYLLASLAPYEAAGDRWGAANALSGLCLCLRRQGDFAEALNYGLQSLAIRRELGDRRGIASSQNNLGLVWCAQGAYEAAEGALCESVDICREIGHPVGSANALTSLTHVALSRGDRPGAIRYQQAALDLFHEVGDLWGVAIAYNNLGQIVLESGDAIRAGTLLREAVALYRRLGIKSGLSNALSNLAWACQVLEAWDEAACYLYEALSLAVESGELPFGLEILVRVASLWTQRDDILRALKISVFVLKHPALLEETRRTVLDLLLRQRAQVSPERTAAVEIQASQLDFQTIAQETLTVLAHSLHPSCSVFLSATPH
ncbi:MAG: tetratricopeptide repeat protein [Anaerolineae bacterium]|nr:tetratricopeptide repeat protein [Anaerolineae bacterium]